MTPQLTRPHQFLPLDNWPPDGCSLAAILRKLTSSASWLVLTDLTRERLSPRRKAYAKLGQVQLVEIDPLAKANKASDPAVIEAVKECQPLLKHWKSGALVAKGRRRDPLSPAVEIRPPTNWELWIADFSQSVIEDPIGEGQKIYDLRFFLPEPPPHPESATGTAGWVASEASRMKAAGEIDESTRKTEVARLLEEKMRKDKSVNPVGMRHIRNKLADWGLWPIASIK